VLFLLNFGELFIKQTPVLA